MKLLFPFTQPLRFASASRLLSFAIAGTALFYLGSCTSPSSQEPTPVSTPGEALARLEEGNRRFVNDASRHPHQSQKRIHETENAQHPYAVVVTCSDSRVSPEIIFDEGIGDLFVIRTAGNLMSDLELGSIEYAVEHLGASLVVVLGHTECGAVKAFVSGGEGCHGHIKDLVESLAGEMEEQQVLKFEGKDLQACIEGNILHGVAQLEADEPILTEKIREKKLAVVPMIYNVHDGKVTVLNEQELRVKHHVEKAATLTPE